MNQPNTAFSAGTGDRVKAVVRPIMVGARPCRVLVVDDDADVRGVAVRMLERVGCQVATATNGQEALCYYEAHNRDLDLVLLDLVMPIMDGYDCCRALVQANPRVRVLIVSGHSPMNADEMWRCPSVRGLLEKPFTTGALVEAVRHALV